MIVLWFNILLGSPYKFAVFNVHKQPPLHHLVVFCELVSLRHILNVRDKVRLVFVAFIPSFETPFSFVSSLLRVVVCLFVARDLLLKWMFYL